MKVLVKRLNEKPCMEEVENSLEALQNIVGGHIQVVPVANNTMLICNEEGKNLDLEINFAMCYGGIRDNGFDYIKGNALFVGYKGEELVSIKEDIANELIEKLSDED